MSDCRGFPKADSWPLWCCYRAAAGYTFCEFESEPAALAPWPVPRKRHLRPLQCLEVYVGGVNDTGAPCACCAVLLQSCSHASHAHTACGANAEHAVLPSSDQVQHATQLSTLSCAADTSTVPGAKRPRNPVLSGLPLGDPQDDQISPAIGDDSGAHSAALRKAGYAALALCILLLAFAACALSVSFRRRLRRSRGGSGAQRRASTGVSASADSSPEASTVGFRLLRAVGSTSGHDKRGTRNSGGCGGGGKWLGGRLRGCGRSKGVARGVCRGGDTLLQQQLATLAKDGYAPKP